jgi:phage tail sheath gpL-like
MTLPSVGRDGGVATMRCATTYRVNRYGTPDPSYLDY